MTILRAHYYARDGRRIEFNRARAILWLAPYWIIMSPFLIIGLLAIALQWTADGLNWITDGVGILTASIRHWVEQRAFGGEW